MIGLYDTTYRSWNSLIVQNLLTSCAVTPQGPSERRGTIFAPAGSEEPVRDRPEPIPKPTPEPEAEIDSRYQKEFDEEFAKYKAMSTQGKLTYLRLHIKGHPHNEKRFFGGTVCREESEVFPDAMLPAGYRNNRFPNLRIVTVADEKGPEEDRDLCGPERANGIRANIEYSEAHTDALENPDNQILAGLERKKRLQALKNPSLFFGPVNSTGLMITYDQGKPNIRLGGTFMDIYEEFGRQTLVDVTHTYGMVVEGDNHFTPKFQDDLLNAAGRVIIWRQLMDKYWIDK